MISTTPASTARQPGDDTVRRSVLPSGLTVVTESVPGSATFAVGFFVRVGSVDEQLGSFGAAHFLEHVLFKGTPSRTAEEISAAFDGVGGDANAYTAKEHTCFYAKVLAEDADVALDVLCDMLTASVIAPADMDAEREVIVDEIAMHNDEAVEVAYALIAEQLFSAPWAREVIGTKESIRAMSPEQLRAFWREHYRPGDVVVSAAGDVDHDALVARLRSWPGEGAATPLEAPARAGGVTTLVTRRKAQEQAACVLAFPGLARGDERRYASDVLAAVLGGGMSARLFVEVRERRGLAYHIDASTSAYAHEGQFTIEWLAGPARVREILGVVRDICADVVRCGITPVELARVQGQLRGQVLLGYDSPEARMMWNGRHELTGDRLTIDDLLAGYAAVSADDVQRVARDLLVQQPVLAVVGDALDTKAWEAEVNPWGDAMREALA